MSDLGDPGREAVPRRPLVFRSRGETGPATPAVAAATGPVPWKVMISDDDDGVHSVSRMLLRDFSFQGRGLEFVAARSGAETRELIARHPDTAVLLLDVVMETEHAGLEVVRHIRDVLKNRMVRIILATGQPGLAPEKQVVETYDINDYREKTELTAQKLATTVMSALRAYRDLLNLDNSRRGLEHIVGASKTLFERRSVRRFAAAVLAELTGLLLVTRSGRDQGDAALRAPASLIATRRGDDFVVTAGTAAFAGAENRSLREVIGAAAVERVAAVGLDPVVEVGARCFIARFHASTGAENVVYVADTRPYDEIDVRLLRTFAVNLGVAFDNLHLSHEVADTQTELIQTLSEVVETRSADTRRHTSRVGEAACLLARLAGVDEREVDRLRQVAPMHDLGKVGIPDAILDKPGPLTASEFALVKTHTIMGYNILKGSTRPILKAAAIVCLQHHEHWAGTGYPYGIAGEEIDLLSRITGLADVFDAVSNDRPYKKAWPPEQVYEYIERQRGRQFAPSLADVFLANFDAFVGLSQEQMPRAAE